MNLNSISIENLRSLCATHSYDLRPLTIVVGANSSGKSTFLRVFPLLRQSVETVTKGPILWFGRIVDFGVFNDAVSRGAEDPVITFGFDITVNQTVLPRYQYAPTPSLIFLEDTKVRVTLKVSQAEDSANTYTKQIRAEILGHSIELNADPDGSIYRVLLDNTEITSEVAKLKIRSGSSLFSMAAVRKDQSTSTSIGSEWSSLGLGAFPDLVSDHLVHLFHGGTDSAKREYMASILGIGSPGAFLKNLTEAARITTTSRLRANRIAVDSTWLKKLQGLLIADRAPRILNEIDRFLSATFMGVSYIGPLRATAERFYRQQDLAVDEVDSEGANLAMFLMGLSKKDRNEFSEWCTTNIGFSVEATTIGAHVSINLRDTVDGGVFNIADMGFGYSQLLPVLATIWHASKSRSTLYSGVNNVRRKNLTARRDLLAVPKIIVIEQPELHLHPRLQGKLADLLVAITHASNNTDTPIHLICETHSETIINRIGALIEKQTAPPNQVQVFLFEKRNDDIGTKVCSSRFGNDGILENWPYGFFLPSDD